jgi:hypothetical protein
VLQYWGPVYNVLVPDEHEAAVSLQAQICGQRAAPSMLVQCFSYGLLHEGCMISIGKAAGANGRLEDADSVAERLLLDLQCLQFAAAD